MNDDTARLNPFPGLRSFRSDEDYLFFGREEQARELVARLQRHRFIAVVGTSGQGKSSLVRCGLLSRLQGGAMVEAGAHWEVAVMHPGGDPFRHLAEAMLDAGLHDRAEENAVPHLLATLRRSQFGLVQAVRQAGLAAGTNFLLVVDQFEEIFRFEEAGAAESEAANDFVAALREACAQTEVPIYVVTTMRSDFIGDCARFEGLAEAVNRGEYLIPRLTREQFKSAIEGPIRVAGGHITPRLLQRLLNDLGEEQDQLPCLQHALMRTWRVGQERGATALDLEDYAQVGKMSQALSVHADEVYLGLASERQRELCAAMFKALTVEGSEKRGIRRPRRLQTLCAILGVAPAELLPVIDAFRHPDVSFLLPPLSVELRDTTVIDLSHESLMRVWTRLRDWVDEEAKSVGIFRRLSESAALWRQEKTGFYRDPELSIARAWAENARPNAAWAAQYDGNFDEAMAFLQASTDAAEAESREREAARQRELEQAKALAAAERRRAEEQGAFAARLKWLVRGLGLVAMVALAAMFIAFAARREAQQHAKAAEVAEAKAQAVGRMADRARGQSERLVAFLLDEFYEDLATTTGIEIVRALAEQAIAYYDGLPPPLQSLETKRNRALASLRLGIALRNQGSLKAGNDAIDAATVELDRLYALDRRPEMTLALAEGLLAQGTILVARGANPRPAEARTAALQRAAALVRPLATAPNASPRIKLQLGRILVSTVSTDGSTDTKGLEEARETLAAIGGRDVSNLNAASYYAAACNNLAVMINIADREPRRRTAEVQAMYRESVEVHEKVLARRPADLNSARGYGVGLSNLARVAEQRFDYAEGLALRLKSIDAHAYAARLDPTSLRLWEDYVGRLAALAASYHERGRIREQQATVRSLLEMLQRRQQEGGIITVGLSRTLGTAAVRVGMSDLNLGQELHGVAQELRRVSRSERNRSEEAQQAAELAAARTDRDLKLIAGKYEAALADFQAVLDRLDQSPQADPSGGTERLRRSTLVSIVICQIMLGRFADAEASGHRLPEEPTAAPGNVDPLAAEEISSDLAKQWLALALALQGKRADALHVVSPLLDNLRERRAKGEQSLMLAEWTARCLFVEGLAQPDSPAGQGRREACWREAVALLDAFGPEAQQSFYVRTLRRMIDEQRAKLPANNRLAPRAEGT